MRIADDGVFVPAFLTGAITPQGPLPSDGLISASATLVPAITLENPDAAGAGGRVRHVFVHAVLYASDGVTVVANGTRVNATMPPASSVTLSPPVMNVNAARLWSIARPYLHVLSVELTDGDAGGARIDVVNITVGLRSVRWDAINGERAVQHLSIYGWLWCIVRWDAINGERAVQAYIYLYGLLLCVAMNGEGCTAYQLFGGSGCVSR